MNEEKLLRVEILLRIGERHRGAERAINERKNIEIYKDTFLEKKRHQ